MNVPPRLPVTARVLVVDDHPVARQGVRCALEEAGIREIAEAGDPVAGYRLFHRIRPDVAIVDLAYRGIGLSGLSLIRRMRALDARARILVLSMHHDPVVAARALKEGAIGFAFKDLPVQNFLEAFTDVYQAIPHLPHTLAIAIASQENSEKTASYGKFSARELEISALILDGNDYKKISRELSLGYRSVTSAVSSMKNKLGSRGMSDFLKDIVSIMDHSQGND
ncbi:response regulator transcription factor [Methylobacterium radiodurans]|uniref:DNA-binding response regulator n=1 Tax=Methylobacterium radiodurans TaxID=2202828 RepID=A0A2U8VY41_9HYPH|nr:response regulator transcription factor [Methylobacterium radiodurans]AWN38687.1 DNA-binding response regulator [Methylobacterium radiodurans]